jgi:predicted PurR-regulated permease PerM
MTMPHDNRKLPLLYILAMLLLVLVLLYWTRVVLMPVAVAVLLSIVLDPLVRLLQRLRCPRAPAMILVVVVALALLGSIGWVVTSQLTSLADACTGRGL